MFSYQPPIHVDLDIIYQDEYMIVINKPSGLLSVPGRGENKQDCLVSRVKLQFPTALIVHRLDMSTSGIIVLALNVTVHKQLSELFARRKIEKKYIAVVDGVIDTVEGEIDQSLICDWPNRPKQKVDKIHGKASSTYYRVIDINRTNNSCRVELSPKTGRTHQLRLHMQFLGHAILGDELYGENNVANKAERLLLHASYIKFIHPVKKTKITLDSPVPF